MRRKQQPNIAVSKMILCTTISDTSLFNVTSMSEANEASTSKEFPMTYQTPSKHITTKNYDKNNRALKEHSRTETKEKKM